MSVSFGDFVRRAREQAGLTQSRLAQLIGKSPTTIRSWEHGRTKPAHPGAVSAMAAVLGLDENELLGQAGFEDTDVAARASRQALSSPVSEQDRTISLANPPDGSLTTHLPEPLPERDQIPLAEIPIEVTAPAASEAKVVTVTVVPPPKPTTPVPEPMVETPIPDVPGPRTRIVVTQQSATGTSVGSSNGYVGALSYVEDAAEKDFYRRRGVITAAVLIFMVIVIWWALGRTGGAIADFIEGILGSLDI